MTIAAASLPLGVGLTAFLAVPMAGIGAVTGTSLDGREKKQEHFRNIHKKYESYLSAIENEHGQSQQNAQSTGRESPALNQQKENSHFRDMVSEKAPSERAI